MGRGGGGWGRGGGGGGGGEGGGGEGGGGGGRGKEGDDTLGSRCLGGLRWVPVSTFWVFESPIGTIMITKDLFSGSFSIDIRP